jgi:hypothetical protein
MATSPQDQLPTLQRRYVISTLVAINFWRLLSKLIFSLNTARDWKQEHAGFNYPSFYNFIVDFFEDANDDDSKDAVNELLQWWNMYALSSMLET